MPSLPDLALDRLLLGPDGSLFAIGSHDDRVCCLMALDTAPLRVSWSHDLGEEATGCQVERVGDALWVFGLLEGPILRFALEDGAPLPPLSLPDADEVLEVAADADGTALVATEPRTELRRIGPDGAARPLWPRPHWTRRLLLGRGGGKVFNVPIARPTGLIPPARLGSGGDGLLRLAGAGCVAALEPDGHLQWVARLDQAVAPMVPPRAAPDGTTYALFTLANGEQIGLYRIEADGSGADLVRTGWFTDLAVGTDGRVLLLTARSLLQLGGDEETVLWQACPTPMAADDPPG